LKTPKDSPPENRKVTSNPEFTFFDAGEEDFLLLCCDGIYEGDIFERQDVINWVAKQMQTVDDIAKVCANLLDECLSRGSRDNMTAMIIQFKNGDNYQSGMEYIPGPWHSDPERDSKFQNAYTIDAQIAGFTLEQAQEKRKQIEAEITKANEMRKLTEPDAGSTPSKEIDADADKEYIENTHKLFIF